MRYKIITFIIIFSLCLSGSRLKAQYALLSSGGNSTDGLVSYSFGQFAFNYYENGLNSVAQGVQHPFEYSGSFFEVPDLLSIVDTAFLGTDNCMGALTTITVAGDDDPVTIPAGVSANFIAGESISFFSGFHAVEGSFMHARITTDGTFCNGTSGGSVVFLPVAKSVEEQPSPDKQVIDPGEKSVKVYPNPNNGQFTLEFTNIESGATVSILNMHGAKVYQLLNTNLSGCKINLQGIRKGLYFVKVMDGKEQFTRKMVVN